MESIKALINMLGGGLIVYNVLFLIAFLFIICSITKKCFFKFPLSIICSFIVSLQLTSIYFTRSFIGYEIFIHFNTRDISSMASLFKLQIIILLLFFIVLIIFFFFSRQIIHYSSEFLLNLKIKIKPNFIRTLILTLSIIGLSMEGGIILKSYEFFKIITVKDDTGFYEALKNVGLKNYVVPSELESVPGKNIIIISLESYEKAYLSKSLSHLTPNLQKLKTEWNYYNMNQNPGGNWTSGSLYTSLTGFPAFFGRHGNSIFQTSYYSNITSIGHVFKKAGYKTSFLIDNAQYSGTEEMLYSLEIENIFDKKNYGSVPKDLDLFNQAKKDIKEKSLSKKPFVLFLSTMSTHNPDGIYDDRMENYIEKNPDSSLKFMVAAVDYMIGDFLQFLKNENILNNTVVYIYPDHLKMGSQKIFEGTGSRGLFFLTNAKESALGIRALDTLDQIDLPKLILQGAEIEHNAKFLTDFIPENKGDFINNNLNALISVNTSGLLRWSSMNFENDPYRFIAHAGGRIDGNTYTNSLEALNYNYSKGFKLFELDFIKTSDNIYVAAHDWEHWAEIVNYNGILPVTHKEFLRHKIYGKYSPLDIDRVNDWFSKHYDAILVTDKVNQPKEFSSLFVSKDRLMMELFSLDAVKEGVEIGLLSSMPSQKVIKNLQGDKIKILKKMGVRDIAVSQRFIESNRILLKSLKQNSIRTFVYHINYDEGKDEEYFVRNEKNFIFGLYADKWNFSN